MLIEYLGNH